MEFNFWSLKVMENIIKVVFGRLVTADDEAWIMHSFKIKRSNQKAQTECILVDTRVCFC